MGVYIGTDGDDTLAADVAQASTLDGGKGNDTLIGSNLDDVIIGGMGNDLMLGLAGNDQFLIGLNSGTDTFLGNDGYDTILATAANARIGIEYMAGIEMISAGGFENVGIVLTAGDDQIDFTNVTLDGIAFINGGGGNNIITGSQGDDVIIGGGGMGVLDQDLAQLDPVAQHFAQARPTGINSLHRALTAANHVAVDQDNAFAGLRSDPGHRRGQ
jgi:Ca2+-binding RTX toxin-like protein